MTRKIRVFQTELKKAFPHIAIEEHDERFTTSEARLSLENFEQKNRICESM